MGTVWVDGGQIGTFTPDTEGTSGDVEIDAVDIGDYALIAVGYVYLDTTQIGIYVTAGAEPPEPPGFVADPRSRTKVFLDVYLVASRLTNDAAEPVAFAVIFANPDYLIELEFLADSDPVDLLFAIGEPISTPMMDPVTQSPYGYEEHVPISTFCIDKTGITATKLKWKAERELRRITENYPTGSQRSLERRGDNDRRLGSRILYSTEFILNYRRDTT